MSESRSSHEERGLKCYLEERDASDKSRSSHEERGLKLSGRDREDCPPASLLA